MCVVVGRVQILLQFCVNACDKRVSKRYGERERERDGRVCRVTKGGTKEWH